MSKNTGDSLIALTVNAGQDGIGDVQGRVCANDGIGKHDASLKGDRAGDTGASADDAAAQTYLVTQSRVGGDVGSGS